MRFPTPRRTSQSDMSGESYEVRSGVGWERRQVHSGCTARRGAPRSHNSAECYVPGLAELHFCKGFLLVCGACAEPGWAYLIYTASRSCQHWTQQAP